MIAVLQRQHVQKRGAMPLRIKAHPGTRMRGMSGRVPRWQSAAAIPARFVASRSQQDGDRRPQVPARGLPGQSVRKLPKLVRSSLLALAVPAIVLLATVLLVPRVRTAALPLQRPLLPSPPETDQDLYRMLVPEEAPRHAPPQIPFFPAP